ncbi:MAG TPA: sigma-70 family RNA polymerase sigma factor [Polyangiaceae bacterium]|nr:sigma-70 family RNA polymerase sigma factor [Polyangiaceae bacterium]
MSPFPEVDARPAEAAPKTAAVPSLAQIFEEHAPFLWRALIGLGVPARDAQDLCQEIMITVHRRLPQFDGVSLRGWLYGICVRVASDYRRSARVRREVVTDAQPEEASTTDPADSLDRTRQVRRLLSGLSRLDEPKREAFVLFEIEELTLAEVSEAVGAPIQTVYSRIKAAREQMQRGFSATSHDAPKKGGISEAR